jgi:hypothetical protein
MNLLEWCQELIKEFGEIMKMKKNDNYYNF